MKICPDSPTFIHAFPIRLVAIEKPRNPLRIIRVGESTMKTAASCLPPLQLTSVASFASRLADFITLMKPRVMALAVFTALVGLMIAPARPDPLLGFIAILAIAAGGGAAGVLNMWYEADIDALMTRTARRPIPRGTVTQLEALAFGLILASSAVAVLALAANLATAALLTLPTFCYGVSYPI